MKRRRSPPSPRAARRAAERAREKLAAQRERLLSLEPGGSPQRPLEVESPSVVEPKAASVLCPRCEVPFRVEEHRAPSGQGPRVREAAVVCSRCGTRRSIWFRLAGPIPS